MKHKNRVKYSIQMSYQVLSKVLLELGVKEAWNV